MNDDLRKRIGSIESLPTFPSMVGKMMNIIEDPKSSVSDLVKHMDPSLVGEVLKVANSAYFGRKSFRRIGTVEQAVATIGYSGLSSIVLQMPFLAMLKRDDAVFDRRGFVLHSLAVGVLARTVSSTFNLGNPNIVYVSGLLHDIGSIVIYQYFNEEWNRIGELIERERLSRLEAERQILTTDHAGVGCLLLEKWDLPDAIVESVRLHHTRDDIGDNENAYVTWLANNSAKEIDLHGDLTHFNVFFDKQRELLRAEMPERYLLKHHVELFERAYDNLKSAQVFLERTSETNDDQGSCC
jgi:putative nucleotidyltransferase with HDIG domain